MSSSWRGICAPQRGSQHLLFVLLLFIAAVGSSWAELTPEEAQTWRLSNEDFDWQQAEAGAVVRITGQGVADLEGNLYFAGSKTLTDAPSNLFVARLDVDGTVGWTREWGTDEIDAATFLALVNETSVTGEVTQQLYVVGYTWGFLDEGGHALNGFGQYGGRDVVLAKVSLGGEKLWMRQFGTTANDFGYGVALDGSFETLLLSGGCVTDQTDETVEVDVTDLLETRTQATGIADYEPQLMDPKPRTSVHHQQYSFAVSLSFDGDILDFAMDGGVTLTPRRRRINEDGLIAEYAIVLNRQPLADVEVVAQDVRLADPSGRLVQQLEFLTPQRLVFTSANWNREQLMRLAAVDDALAEGRHYAVVTHSVASADPNFDGMGTPFLSGHNVTLQIDDNDRAGVSLSRRHVFIGEGGGEDSYEVVLTSRPWHPVTVVVVPLHADQTAVVAESSATQSLNRTGVLVFQPEDWDTPQRLVVKAVDDTESEVEYGGLYDGGPLLHYTVSRDIRYHSQRPQCFDVPNCDPLDPTSCLLSDSELQIGQTAVRVCDLTTDCAFSLGNGACIASVINGNDSIPSRFGSPSLDPGNSDDTAAFMSYANLRQVLLDQEKDRNLIALDSGSSFEPPPPELRSFVLSFLGLMNVEQARKMSASSKRTLHAICSGLVRLETMRWAFEEWPAGYVDRVLNATFAMFPQSFGTLERHAWNCGMATFLPGNSIDVSVWDNDPGVTLSTASLEVSEGDSEGAVYSIVLNAPPSIKGQAQLSSGYCTLQSDTCGFWGEDISSLASNIYDQTAWTNETAPNVSIAIVGNSQLEIEPSLVTFTATNWFVPQRVVVHAVDDAVAELSANFTLSHRVQNSIFGYSNSTAFWFQGTVASAGQDRFPLWEVANGSDIPFNPLPTVLHSPDHALITVLVQDNDVAKVNVAVNQPQSQLTTKEARDAMHWVGDYVTALAFHDVSLSSATTGSTTMGTTLSSVLLFARNVFTVMKFHLPRLHDGDSTLAFKGATLVLSQTPYKVFNVSQLQSGSSTNTSTSINGAAKSEQASFSKVYLLKVTVIENGWTPKSLANTSAKPAPVAFLPEGASIQVTATVEKSRSIEVDVSSLLARVLPTRLSTISLQIEVLAEVNNLASISTTQLCSSLFERKLRPLLSLAYQFPNLLQGLNATQSSTVVSQQTGGLLTASLATNGADYHDVGSSVAVATTQSERDPWWEVMLPQLTKLGTLAVFLPASILPDSSTAVNLVLIASLKAFNGQALSLGEALAFGCPELCPRAQRMPVRKGILLWDVQAGAVAVRIYREGLGVLQLSQVRAFDAFVAVTLTGDGAGIRSRLKSEWGPNMALLQSWRLLQTVRDSEEENLATGMTTRQSSTSPSYALAYLAVDGLQHSVWDPLLARIGDNSSMKAGSTRTEAQQDPWWEVDLGSVKPVRSVVLYPYIGSHSDALCAPGVTEPNGYPAWSGDLFHFSRTDPLLQLEAPFKQQFDVLLSDSPLTNRDGSSSSATVTANASLSFSCTGYSNSIEWSDVFAKGRFITVKKRGLGVLMLTEVQVFRWNSATRSRYLLLDLFGKGEKPLALASVQVFPPGDVASTTSGPIEVALPVPYKVHSVSSQLSSSGYGSAMALRTVNDSSECYVASRASFHEWVVLEFARPMEIGLIDVGTNVSQCIGDVEAVEEFTVASHGSVLDGIRSKIASQALTIEGSSGFCSLDATGVVLSPSATCQAFVCVDSACQSPLRALDATGASLVLSDFVDMIVLGKAELLPVTRLPLSQNEHRALVLRDNPVILWPFDTDPKVFVAIDARRVIGALELDTVTTSTRLSIDDDLENTFFSKAVVLQPAMSPFSIEFWVLFDENFVTLISGDSAPPVEVLSVYGSDEDGQQKVFGRVGIGGSSQNSSFFFEVTDPNTATTCKAELEGTAGSPPLAETWQHVVAIYDPAASSLSLSIRVSQPTTQRFVSSVVCNLPMLSLSQKSLNFGALSAEGGGFVGKLASVAWYVRALTNTEMLDHFHDFLEGVTAATTETHNTYTIQLASKPMQPVTVQVNAENACYRFNLCNVSAVPSTLVFTAEDWAIPKVIRVVATDDQLYEGTHSSEIFHTAASSPSYQLTSSASTASVNSAESGRSLLTELETAVAAFYQDLVLYRALEDENTRLERQETLVALQSQWAQQSIETVAVAANAYNALIPIASLSVSLIDLTIPGIEFSTSSLSVSEAGNGNDYQVVLLSEPKEAVQVTLHIVSDCYRRCVAAPLCPSHSVVLANGDTAAANDETFLSCGDDSESNSTSELLCNVTVSPDILFFSPKEWNSPQTVRVLAVDDHLDEADVHFTVISATSQSLDATYDQLLLPDILVAIEDNDETNVRYSTKLVSLSEKGLSLSTRSYPQGDFYTLQLLTEPYANVTIAMSNEANQSCYRRCGYAFDTVNCGLPRQQSVSLVTLRSNSTREIHQITLKIPKITEVQRIATFSRHVDQIFRLQVAGGFSPEVQTVVFQFSDVFKQRFPSNAAVLSAASYGRSFRVINADGSSTAALDGFATAQQLQTSVNGLFAGLTSAVNVTRELQYPQSTLTWTVTFLRFVIDDGTFPLLSVAVDTSNPMEGALTSQRLRPMNPPNGTFQLSYGASTVQVPMLTTAAGLQSVLGTQTGINSVSTTRRMLTTGGYGFKYNVTFASVDAFASLTVNSSTVVAASDSLTLVTSVVTEIQPPVLINGAFILEYFSPINGTDSTKRNRTAPIFWNDSAETLTSKLVQLQGLGNVTVGRQRLSAEGGMAWTLQFLENNGNLSSLRATSLNLTGQEITVGVTTVRDGESLRGNFSVQMGGLFKKIDAQTTRASMQTLPLRNTTAMCSNSSAKHVQKTLLALNITELTNVSRVGVDCDVFSVCNGYIWIISYRNSPGDLPPIAVFADEAMSKAPGLSLTASTVANGTYLGGSFSLRLELLDPTTNFTYIGTTWHLPVNVSAVGMDEALEALAFVRSNREAEYDPETKIWRGIQFDKGVRVYREGPFLDGGYTWRLEWALEDYLRFADLKITVNVSQVIQEVEPFPVPSELDLQGKPRCAAIPTAVFQADPTEPLGVRGHCVYAIVNETVQERFLCNYTVLNPWIVFTPENWCVPQQVELEAIDDYLDEHSPENGAVTISKVTHSVFSDDYVHLALPLPSVTVVVESEDVAKVLVSESALNVSEDGALAAAYFLQLNSEPLADVRLVVLPWLDGEHTQCYRFGLCNVTLPVTEFLFTPKNWNVRQKVVVLATDDSLDEADVHSTGISHVSYSDDPKYNAIPTIPKINVTVYDNDKSRFTVSKTQAFVTEGLGAVDNYSVVLTTEPFAKVTVSIVNVGLVGNLARVEPSQLVFTWRNWNVSQTVFVAAVDDLTQDPAGSSSTLNHSLTTNDFIYAGLRNLTAVTVVITDNDVSGLELSTHELHGLESNSTVLSYAVRLTSEPWRPVIVQPNASHDCYLRVLTAQRVCNTSILGASRSLYFGAGNWSVWQNVSLLAVDDWLDEAAVHSARISHASLSADPLYNVAEYPSNSGDVTLFITDNDVSFVTIALESATQQLHVTEGSFNDSYSLVLTSEPYNNVTVTLRPTIESIVSLTDQTNSTQAPQVGVSYGSLASSSMTLATTASVRAIDVVFTSLDWMRPRIVTVFAIDDEISEAATQYSTIIHAVASADANYNVSNSSIGIVSVTVAISDREAIPPPLPLTAIFDSSGSKVDVAFDSTVFHAASMDVSSSGAYVTRLKTFNCSLVFNLASAKYSLGSQASCLWLDGKSLRLELGAGATLAAADKLVLNDCTSFTDQYCNATDVLRAKPTSRAFSQASIAVQVPSDIVQPNAVLVVPEDVGSCGVWSADASLSSGAGGRPFARFVWFAQPSSLYPNASSQGDAEAGLALSQRLNGSLDSLCTKYMVDWKTGKSSVTFIPTEDLALASSSSSSAATDLSTFSTMAQLRSACFLRSIAQAATASGAVQLHVNSSLLEPGTEYRVGLELVNAIGQRTVAVKAIQMRSLPGPAVFIVGDSTQNVTRVGAPLLLQVDSVVSCPSVSGTDVRYRWIVSSQSSSDSGSITTEDLSKDNLARDPRVFRLPRTSLQADRIYTFRVEAYTTGSLSNQSSSSFASVMVSVASSAPQVSITGGDCAIGDRDMLLLDGSGTVDPDASSTALTYSWACQDVTDSLASPTICKDASTSPVVALNLTASPNAVLKILPFKLQFGRQLQFSLTASKGSLKATASTVVWIVEGHLPIVRTSASAAKINPSSRFTMEAQVSSDYPYTARWEQTQGDLVLPDAAAGDSSDAFALPLTSLSNAIRKNKLTAGLIYDFRLVASDSEGNVGFGSVSVVVNSPPSSGTFTVTPQSGYAMQDVFTLSCSQWSDNVDDFPLTYSFGVLSTSSFQTLSNATTDISALIEQLLKAMTPLVANQRSPQATSTMFPPVNMQDSEEMTVVAFISDTLGAVAVASASIEVLIPAEAKSQPVAFVAGMFTSDGSLRAGGDAADNLRGVMSVALVLENAFTKKSSTSGIRRLSVGCADGFMGPDCTIAVALVQQVDAAILSTVAKAASTVEPSSSGLGLQARVLGSLMRGAPEVLTASAVTEVTRLSSVIANSALGLEVPADFVNSAGSTLVEVVSAVLVLGTAETSRSSDAQRRRLTEVYSSSSNASVGDGSCEDQEETAQTKASLANILQTLLSLAAVGSQELLADEPPAVLTAGNVTAFSARGVTFTAQPTSTLAMNLTTTAVACLDSDLFLDALAFVTSPHSNCSLNESQAISPAMVFSVHSQAAFDQATASFLDDGIAMQTLASTSVCVVQASEASRRLTAESTAWNPLVALTIPHDRELSAIEQSNFSTTCRTWDPEISRWVADVCFKDDSASTSELTVCYCTQLDAALEVLVTLEERLDYYALHPDLYRHDPPSLVVSVTLVVLVAAFVIVAKAGQRLDARDAQREKATTIRRLNRAKWSELEARTQAANVFDDFDVFYAAQQQKKKLELQVSEAQTALTADGEASVTGFSSSARGSRVHNLSVDEPLDPTVELPDEVRTLFGSSRPLSRQYARLTLLFRLSNLLLALLGIVLLLAGLEMQFVLGHSPAELVLNLYGGPLGLVLIGSGALLLVGGIAGVLLARREASNAARTAYLTALGVALLLQLLVVALVFHSLEGFGSLPRGMALTLRSHWDSLSEETKTQLQVSYGCCGFLTINEQTACPEEALDAVPPRTCSMVLATQAQTLFSSSFGYVQAIFLVEMACVALANLLVRWRRLRLLQLAAGDAVDAPMLRSQLVVALLCSLPPLYALLATGAATAALFGLDLLLHWHFMTDALVSALFGLEIGAIVTAAAVLYLLLMLRALHVLGARNVLALRWVAVLLLAFLLLTMGFNGYLTRLRVDFPLDPTISEAVEAKYVALPRSTTLLELEMAMGCCGFRINSQGSCMSSEDAEVPTCRLQVEQALVTALALATDRLTAFAVVQAVVLALTFWLCLRLRRFARLTGIRPTTAAEQPVLRLQSPSEHVCLAGLTLLNVGAAAAGVGVLCLGLDLLLELNVLHLTYLLRVFDRRLGVYLLALGGCMELFAALGSLVAWMGPRSSSPLTRARRHRLVVFYMLACVLLFLTAFGLLGVSYKLFLQLTPASNADDVTPAAVNARLEDRWRSASSSTKQFVQNALQCCGYERVEAANGSVSFTLPAEQFAWRRLTTTTTHYVYKTREHSTVTESWTPRLLTETQAETPLNGSALCPVEASDGCMNPMKRYLSRVARLGWQLCAGLASFSVAALICCCGLQVGSSSKTWTPNWRLRLKRAVLLLVVLLGGLTALVCLFLGVDVAAGWTLFSSSALQLVFARSLGAALVVYAILALLTHGYSARAALTYSVHQLFLQIVTRFVLAFALFAGVAFTAHLSRYSTASDESWHEQLTAFLDDQWSALTPATQHAIALEFACCGFNDPVLVAGQGVVFDRPALGYPSCSLALSRGCKRPLAAGVTSSFAWLFSFLLALALMELTAMALGALVLRDVRLHEREAWFKLESRLRYVLGSFRRDFRRHHVLVSVAARYDARLTRAQRAVSVLCAWAASLAVFAGHFATQGCYRSALKTCEQPAAAELLGLALVYGGLVGVAVQAAAIALFELVRHRVDHETKEVASARQRKEKVLLFRSSWFPRRHSNGSSTPSLMAEQTASGLATSTLDTTQTTTEERWYAWLTRFVAGAFQTCGVVLFLGGCALATLLGLLRLGYNNSLYGVSLDDGIPQLLGLALALVGVSLLVALANDLREQQAKQAHRRKLTPVIVTLVAVAITATLALGAVLLAVFMVHEVVQDDATAWTSWSVRVTGFGVVERLQAAWNQESSGYMKDAVQQELRCCGFQSATDAPFLPCPDGDPVQVTYEALSVSGAVVATTKQEFEPLPGCFAPMLARFQRGADVATYCALSAAALLFLLTVSALFLARDLAISKDSKLKLRVPDTSSPEENVRETFATVVGLKIAAPTRGKLRSQLLASSLESVTPAVASELAAAPLKHEELLVASAPSSQGRLHDDDEYHDDYKEPQELQVSAKEDATAAEAEADASVPYPASVVYVVFSACLLWLAIMAYVVAVSATELGLATSWRCVLAWAVGVAMLELVVEPVVLFVAIVARTLRDWWSRTLLVRLLRRGRAALRIGPQDAAREQLVKSLTLYERLRFAAAVRIQRRLLTRVTRTRYLRRLRDHKQEQHRLLATQRRETLRKTLASFSEEEIEAFRLLFVSADAPQLGLVSHTTIAHAVYELGVQVPASKVRELLEAFDPAYADLVDFEHFLYGMHCVRLHHQQLQVKGQSSDAAKTTKSEQLLSPSDRFGPGADPRATLLVKRQNLLRELQDRRESLAHKLLRKVSGRLPPLLQRGKSARAGTPAIVEPAEELVVETTEGNDTAAPSGSHVLWQNRKLSPKKRALESVLKKKHRDRVQLEQQQGATTDGRDTDGVVSSARVAVKVTKTSPSKTSVSLTRLAMKKLANRTVATPRGATPAMKTAIPALPSVSSEAVPAIPLVSTVVTAPAGFDREEEKAAIPAVSASKGGAEGLAVAHASPVATATEKETTATDEVAAAEAELKAMDNDTPKEEEPKLEEKAPKASATPEEAKPFGAYLLLTKQSPLLSGKSSGVVDKEKSQLTIADEEMGAQTHIDADSEDDAIAPSPHPVSAAKLKVGGAQSALEKALLKKKKVKSKIPDSGGGKASG